MSHKRVAGEIGSIQVLFNNEKSASLQATLETAPWQPIDAQATADRVSETPTLLLGRTGSKLSPVSSAATFDPAKLAAAIRSSLG